MYKHLMTMAGGKLTAVNSYPDFRFHADRVEKAITPRTKLLILNSPSNPTGAVMTQEELDDAIALARKHDLVIISDEIYEEFSYRRGAGSPAKQYDRTLVLRGYSKSHAMTGWRLGYAAGPTEIIQQMVKLQQYTFVCAPAPMQVAAVTAEDCSMTSHVEAYQRKRDMIYDRLSKRFEVVKPQGAFYIFPKAPKGMTASEFCTKAIERNVLVIPGNVFSAADTHFRISYATTDEKIAQGCEILCDLAK
jgi:aspartate aminotransferase/aminotransferase